MAEQNNQKKVAILLKTNVTPEEILVAVALYQYYLQSSKQVDVVFERNDTTAQDLKKLDSSISLKDTLPPRKIVLSLKRNGTEVENVQWQQEGDSLNIYLSLNQGFFNPADLKFNTTGADYDLAILPNVTSLSQLGTLATENVQFFKDCKLFSIGSELDLDDQYQFSSSNKPNLSTLGEQVLAVVDPNQLKPETSQLLWDAIMLETDHLQKALKSTEIFLALKKLVEKGASPEGQSK